MFMPRAPYLPLGLALLVALPGLSACGAGGGPPKMPPPEVTAVTVEPRNLPATFEYVGQVAGIREVEVRPRVSGILEKWNYTEGAAVQAGQSLFTIDPAPFRAALERADAQLAAAQATREQAQRLVDRLKPLYDTQLVSQQDYDNSVSALQVAEANVAAAKAALTEARLNLDYTRVEAPITGITSRALMSEGSLVTAQQTLLTTISQIDPIYVTFSFTEDERLKFTRAIADKRLTLPRDGKFDVALTLADGTNYAHTGKVNFTDVRVNTSTGTIDARAVMPNPEHLLSPGQFVRVKLSGAVRTNVIAIPQRAVLEGPNTKIVMLVNGQGLVEPRPVQVDDWTGDEWLITGGLKPGETVIIDGVVRARPGAPVTIAQPAPAAGAPPAGQNAPAAAPPAH